MRDFPAIAEQYIASVLDGSQLTCRKFRLTIERHVRDLERSAQDPTYPFRYDPQAGVKVCRLFEAVQPSKWPTKMEMSPWMVAVTLILYGWKYRANGLRRFRQVYLRWPRKTGKSAYLSVLGLNALIADGERGAEVYSAALTEEQARRVFDESVEMRNGTPVLRKATNTVGNELVKALTFTSDGSKSIFRPLSRDKETMEGLNVHFAACDEVHKWKNRGAWDVLRYGMRARKQPMIVAITTAPAADDTASICNTLDNYADKVLNGVIEDERFFCVILEIDPEVKNTAGEVIQEADRWDDKTKWIKACPNLGVTVQLEDMEQEALEASNDAESLNAFMRYALNIRVDAVDQPIATADWNNCALQGDPRELREQSLKKFAGRICLGALDLAIIDDTSAFVLLFPPMAEGEKWHFVPTFWIPEQNIAKRCRKDLVPYDVWRDQGFLITTSGKTTDYSFIRDRILEASKLYDLREMIYDPALASGLVKELLTSGFKKDRVIKFAQTPMNYAAPCGDFTRTISRRELTHDANPVLRWHITNLRWKKNYTGLIMPDKEKSIEKIDGAVASIMAFGRGMHPDNAKLLLKPKAKVTVL